MKDMDNGAKIRRSAALGISNNTIWNQPEHREARLFMFHTINQIYDIY